MYANPAAERNLALGEPGSLTGRALFDFVIEDDHEKLITLVRHVLATGRSSDIASYTSISMRGRCRDMETIAAPICLSGEAAVLNVCRDVTQRNRMEMALRESEARFETLARHSPEAIIAVSEQRIILANEAAADLLGASGPECLKDQDVLQYCLWDEQELIKGGCDLLGRGNAVTKQLRGRFRRQDGLPIDLEATSIPYLHNGKPAAYLILRDVTERLRAEEHHRYLASHDALTDLPNRLEFQRRLRTLLTEREDADTSRFAIHYLDLDYFKSVNDALGHDIGDRLLQLVAARLRNTVRSDDLVARLGGDEFAVLQIGAHADEAPRALAEKLQRAIERPYTIGDQLLHTSTTIGIAVYPDHGTDPDQLIRRADLALYHAKECGRNAVRFFNRDLDVRVQERDSLINQLIRAEASGEFEVYFQPIACLASGRIDSVEALLRWNHPERGLMSAEDFIHAIEASRESQRIGAWVLHQACAHAKTWEGQGLGNLRVAVNLSMPFLQRPDFTDVVLETLRVTGLDACRLELELTERIIISAGAASIAARLNQLRDLGVHIALDDFGTGYSSLALLKDLPVDRIKIDRSFIAGFGTSSDDTAIVRAVTNLGRSLNKRVTAEGVESSNIMDLLRDEGCHDIQGYHLAKPMSASALVDFLQQTVR
ncbi:MAG: EAL domain-containing protein [Pseudomonadota bacterium]